MKEFFAVLRARNLEFLRDRSALGWNIAFPFMLVIGFAIIFSDDNPTAYKVGLVGERSQYQALDFYQTRYLEFVSFETPQLAQQRVDNHKIDMAITLSPVPLYWINSTSPNGYILEKILRGTQGGEQFQRQELHGEEIRYVDWVLPGVLGLNIMFSCLFGVGYVIVRYRKNGFLKRLKATPLSPMQFLLAQLVSRLLLIEFITIIVYLGCDLLLDFHMQGSLINLFVMFMMGSICLIALGLLIAARLRSEELAGGILNLITWPMMLLSGVFFSLEGTPQWVQTLALGLPLTHMVDGARAIMTEGAGFLDLGVQYLSLGIMTLIFLLLGALIFRWE